MRREVRCCCDPGKLLGTMEVDENLYGPFTPIPGVQLEVADVITGAHIIVEQLFGRKVRGDIAIKSNDYPIEKLKEIPTFKEV